MGERFDVQHRLWQQIAHGGEEKRWLDELVVMRPTLWRAWLRCQRQLFLLRDKK